MRNTLRALVAVIAVGAGPSVVMAQVSAPVRPDLPPAAASTGGPVSRSGVTLQSLQEEEDRRNRLLYTQTIARAGVTSLSSERVPVALPTKPPAWFNPPASCESVSASQIAGRFRFTEAPVTGAFRRGGGIFAGIGGSIAAGIGSLFRRRKDASA